MFWKKQKNEPTILDGPIQRVLDDMETYGPDSEEFPALVSYLERLMHLKAEKRREPVSWDTIAIIGGNLLGILIVVSYERNHAMVSKALTFILKPKPDYHT